MFRITAQIILILSTLFCFGCTEDSDDDNNSGGSSTVAFSGVWRGSVSKSQDICAGLPDGNTLIINHLVTQTNQDIVLRDQGSSTYLGSQETHFGSTTGKREFTVEANVPYGELGCTLKNYFTYSDVSDETAEVTRELIKTCNGAVECRAVYEGNVTSSNSSSRVVSERAAINADNTTSLTSSSDSQIVGNW